MDIVENLELAARYREILRQALYVVRSIDADGELSTAQTSTLNMLAAAPMRIGLIARNAGIRVPSATEQVTKLAAAGLVERVPSHTDARVVEVRLTEEGRRTLKAANLRRNREMARAFDSLSPRERQAINLAIPAIEKLNVALSP
ncbi:MarR family transcriptional regulator [Arthrobacter sp. H35-D1]|uniref:MarR family winged helix-turn-helix transcriptional regulator n=1 Tax=Arthrobacter sp. H35-D1 TaxID=3046202 RepID=UPI0024B99A45|nr:MarR family transcriptional regulator [Arthrobacter sp. H35-D1]MDJ0315222.1 MarR family transcriptional regulator [Arthrobacter sp. H35-D1]